MDTRATCTAYLRALRISIREGAEGRAAIDSLRDTTNELWLRLPLEEKRRFRRHLQRRWDVVRHRMAPSIADFIESEIQNKTLEIRKGHLEGVDVSPAGAQVIIRSLAQTESFHADRVINCTGPTMNYRRVSSTLLQNLFRRGYVTAGALGAGFHCAENGAVIDPNGRASGTIFTLGPSRQGDLLESIAVPEIRQQAVDLALTLKERLNQNRTHAPETVEGILMAEPVDDRVTAWRQ